MKVSTEYLLVGFLAATGVLLEALYLSGWIHDGQTKAVVGYVAIGCIALILVVRTVVLIARSNKRPPSSD